MSGPLWVSRGEGVPGTPQHPAELAGTLPGSPGPAWRVAGLAKSLPAQGNASALPFCLSWYGLGAGVENLQF